ncbi:transcriptional repressor, partial [bacterium]|nr:transcriptional repressor [bacterium]
LALLKETEIHPTADWIYAQLKPEFPHLSLGTVYRNLAILTEQGLVKKIQSGSAIDRYEAKINQHYHLICTRCDSIRDLELPIYEEINDRAGQMTAFHVKEHRIYFYGLCSSCMSQNTGT